MSEFDWSLPIETEPTDHNPDPVPCAAIMDRDSEDVVHVVIQGNWFDPSTGTPGEGRAWAFDRDTAKALLIDCTLRNAEEPDN